MIFKPDLPQRFYNESMQQIHVKRSRPPFRKEITLLRNERQKAESGGKGQNIPADARQRNELQKQENRLLQKEENLDRKHEGIDKREAMLEKKDHSLNERQQHIEEMESKVDEMIRMQQSELERISSLTRDEAKQIILDRVENELSHDIAIMTKETENRAKEEADKKAKNILSLALQRCAADHVAETTVSKEDCSVFLAAEYSCTNAVSFFSVSGLTSGNTPCPKLKINPSAFMP